MDNTLTNEHTHTSSKTRILAQIGMLGAHLCCTDAFRDPTAICTGLLRD